MACVGCSSVHDRRTIESLERQGIADMPFITPETSPTTKAEVGIIAEPYWSCLWRWIGKWEIGAIIGARNELANWHPAMCFRQPDAIIKVARGLGILTLGDVHLWKSNYEKMRFWVFVQANLILISFSHDPIRNKWTGPCKIDGSTSLPTNSTQTSRLSQISNDRGVSGNMTSNNCWGMTISSKPWLLKPVLTRGFKKSSRSTHVVPDCAQSCDVDFEKRRNIHHFSHRVRRERGEERESIPLKWHLKGINSRAFASTKNSVTTEFIFLEMFRDSDPRVVHTFRVDRRQVCLRYNNRSRHGVYEYFRYCLNFSLV